MSTLIYCYSHTAADNTTKVATTAYVSTAIANLADSAPSTLNTLNELAAALGDDANYATTTTNAIATKLPLAGGTLTGTLIGTELNLNAAGDIHSTVNNSYMGLSGGTETNAGANIVLYGQSHGSLANTSVFRSSGTERMRIDSSGKVMIGSTNPGTGGTIDLSVGSTSSSGGITLWSPTGSAHSIGFGDGYTGTDRYRGYLEYLHSNDSMRFGTSATERMRIQGDGRVGIGATPSDYWGTANGLVVREGDNSTGITIATSTSNTGQIYFADGTSGDARYRGWITYSHGTDTMQLATSASTQMIIDSAGKVGIGNSTNDPGARLLVKSLGGGSELVFKTTDASNNMVFEVQGGGKAAFNYGPVLIAGTTDIMHANMDDLQVGNAVGNRGMTIASGNGSYGTLAFADGSSGNEAYRGFVEYYHNEDSLRLGTSGTEAMRIDSSGNVQFNGGPVKGMRQAVQYQGATNSTSISANSNATFQSTTITTTGNSKLVVWAHSGQILKLQQNSNPWMRIAVNGTYIGAAHEGHHYWYGISSGTSQRLFLTEFGVSGTLAAGTHTVTMVGGTYAADMTFNYQNQSGHMVIMEVGA